MDVIIVKGEHLGIKSHDDKKKPVRAMPTFQKEEVVEPRRSCDWSLQTSPAAHSLAGR